MLNTMQLAKKRISVVIPLYNKADTILQTLQSVLEQTYAADEIIVVDDGSTDSGIDKVEKTYGEQVIIIKQSNAGVSAARNRGIEAAKGDFVAFLDADDFWSAHYIEEIQRMIKRYPQAGLIGTRYQYLDSGNRYSNPKIRFDNKSSLFGESQLKQGIMSSYFAISARGDLPFNASTVTMKKTLLRTLKGFPVGEAMGEDQDLWARAALSSVIAYSPRVLGFYNRAADNRTCNNKPAGVESPFSQRLHRYAKACPDKSLRAEIIDYTAAHLRHLALQNIYAGQYSNAKNLLSDPRCARQWFKYARICYLLKRAQGLQSIGRFNSPQLHPLHLKI